MPRTLVVFVVLLCTWLLWSGVYEPLTIGLGVLSCAAVAWFTGRLEEKPGAKTDLMVWARMMVYIPWLLKEIVVSNLHVARIILTPGMPITPQLLRVSSGPKTALGQALYANSITLTPGTITLDVRDDRLLVHALTTETADGVREAIMDHKCSWVEGQS